MSLSTGEIIEGKYRIVRLIGEGGMGAVYEGENTRIHRRVAIKVLHQGVAENQEAVQRFEREAQAAGRIGNDHILEVIDLGSLSNGDHFMVMEYLDGEPLSERIRRLGKMRPEEIAPLMIQALEGLRAAHDAGIVHRDLKPDNVYVLKEKAGNHDFVKLIDFGISKFQPVGGEMKMTRTGTVMGTPYYMSPEQASGSREADHRSDLYAVGVMLYEAVTGRVPFDAPTFNQLLFQIVLSDPAPPQQVVPDLDPGFANLIAKAMSRDVEHRFQTSQALSEALASWLQTGASVSVPPMGPMNPLVPRAAFGSAPALDGGAGGARQSVLNATTPESWASSQVGMPDGVPKGKTPLLVAAALTGLVFVGMAFGVYKLVAGKSDAAPNVAASAVATSEPIAPVAAALSASAAPSKSAPPIDVAPTAAASIQPTAVSSSVPVVAVKPVPAVAQNKPASPTGVGKGTKPAPVLPVTPPKPDKSKPTGPARPPAGRGGPVDFGY
jgi:eukaryotic-like serine/threonine-protein kinase